jgi:hypothetical protein
MTTVHNIDDAAWQGDYNYYTRPIDDSNVMYLSSLQTLAQFKTTVSPQEFHSAKSIQTITTTDVIQFFYNATKTNKVITLTQPMIDVKDTKYTTNITLLPFSSVILMLDSNPSASPGNLVYVSSVVEDATPDILEINYNLSLTNIMPDVSTFEVLVNSYVRPISSINIAGTNVFLKLVNPVSPGDIVTFSYFKPTINNLQSFSGGQAASLTGQTVNNNLTSKGTLTNSSSYNNKEEPSIILYPNPAHNFINIVINELSMEPIYIKIIDFWGKVVLQKIWDPDVRDLQIPINLLNGIYFVQILSDKLVLNSLKLIVNN